MTNANDTLIKIVLILVAVGVSLYVLQHTQIFQMLLDVAKG